MGWLFLALTGFIVVADVTTNQSRRRQMAERERMEKARIEQATAVARAEELRHSRTRMVAVSESLRREIAQHLHGSVQNKLILLLHRIKELGGTAPSEEMAQELGDLHRSLGELIEGEVRSISQQLYPSILRRGLTPAVQSLGDQFEAALPIQMDVDDDLMNKERADSDLVPEQVRLAAYRIAENALSNVLKHAGAKEVVVTLGLQREEGLRLTVRDDGRGFDVEGASDGLGLGTMQDYADVVGGKCVVHSAPGEGTEVTATLPLGGPGGRLQQTGVPSV